MRKNAKALGPPFIGALLRLTWQHVRAQMLRAVQTAGFTDLDEAHFAIFSYPLPDGVRPSELARQIQMSRQAINYLVAYLEQAGYLERRSARGSTRRLIYLTKRGWKVAETIFAALQQTQAQWADKVGHERFAQFMGVLRLLAEDEAVPREEGVTRR